MEEFITATVVAGLFYGILRFFKISWLKQAFPASFIYLAGVFAWSTALALVAALVSLLSMMLDLVGSFDTDTLIPFIIVLIVLGIAVKLLMDRKEILDIPHMIPFLRSALLFQPYDAKRQELLERNEKMQLAQAKKAAAERTSAGKPAEEIIDISDDAGKEESTTSGVAETSQVTTELDLLKRGEGVDISEIFRANTAKLPAHPLYQFISMLRIDPSDKLMSFRMVFPSSATEPELTPEKLQRIKQGIYQVYQALTVEQWLKPYLAFFTSIKTTCFRIRKDEFDMTREIQFMTVQTDIAQVRQHRGKPFNGSEFEKMASIAMEG